MSAISMAKKTLSVCLIVKDEERVLGRCLFAAVQFADELIVVDTGSKDRSREIAGEYTDLVFSEPWQNSFAVARNFAASKATCDFVMWLDADDVMEPNEIRKLNELKERLNASIDVVFVAYRNYGFLSDIGLRDRIHRRELSCRWEGDIHEAICIGADWSKLLCPEITIIHKKEHVNDPDRNIRMFEDIKKTGKLSGAFALAFFCRELALRDYKDKALDAWQDMLTLEPSVNQVQYALVFLSMMLLRQKEYEKCRMLIHTAADKYKVPLSAFFRYQLGLAAEGMGDTKEAERQYRLATDTPVDTTTGMIEFTGYDNYLPCIKLCALAYDSGDMASSEAWNNRAGQAWPQGRAWRINRERFFSPMPDSERNPLISVIMPACNAKKYISGAVSSILDQSWQNFELIIVDDDSTDDTYDVIRGFTDPRIRLLRNDRRLGNAFCKNRAISVSKGEYIALMDASDISLPDRLQIQLAFMENNRDIMIAGTASVWIDPEGKIKERPAVMPGSPKHYQAKLLTGNVEFCDSSAMIRKSFLKDNVLFYREEYSGLEDYRFYMEASKMGSISCLADTLYKHRVCDDLISSDTTSRLSEERAQKYNNIRCESLRMSKVRLSKENEFLLGQLLPEGALPLWNRHDREALTDLFTQIRGQLAKEGFPAITELDEILWSVLNH